MANLYIADRIYLPEDDICLEDADAHYKISFYDEASCRKCEYLKQRHCDMCDDCPAFKESVILYKSRVIKGEKYLGFPVGDKVELQSNLGIYYKDYTIRDLRTSFPFDYNIKFLGKLRPIQEQLCEDFMRTRLGIIEAPPRTGKTITCLHTCLSLGQRTLVLASQHEFLQQFIDHLTGNAKSDTPKCTNLPELEKKYGQKLFGFPKTRKDYETMQFACMTYQSLLSDGKGAARLKLINENYGTLFIDEVHKTGASGFARTVSNIKSKYKFGCTGTVTRKDSRHILTRKIIGPVAASTSIEALIPTVYLHPTKVPTKQFNYGMASSGYANQYLANDRQRNKLIVSMVLDDLDRGHSIVIPVLYKAHVKELQRLINDAYGSNICGVFVGGNKKDRESTIAKARSRNIKVVVGIRSMLQLNINVPAWSCIYEVMPINNRENLKQETARVCTPKEGKRPPIIRMFLDYGVGISIGCAKASLNHMTEFGYKLAGTDRQVEIQNSLSSGAKRNTVKTKYANNSTGRMGLWKKS